MPVAKALLDMLMRQREYEESGKSYPHAGMATRRIGSDGMPILDRDDDLSHALMASDITAHAERGEDIPSHLYQGLSPAEVIEALGTGGQLRGLGGAPATSFQNTLPTPQEVLLPNFVEQPEQTPETTRIKKAEALDAHIQRQHAEGRPGYSPEIFTGKTHAQAVQLISDQLRARREALLGPAALSWMGAFQSDI